ncbi:MAG: aminoacyl-tRNA hydrolase [Planctomycetes bacterium]|nr:aminoacyl-tRNA hydrolase [Planctomycetota bacterium]
MPDREDWRALEWRPGRFIPEGELSFSADTSGGPGGQHANRSATRISLFWEPRQSAAFSEDERARLLHALAPRLSREGILRVRSGSERSARQNRLECCVLLCAIIRDALRPIVPRKRTKRTRTSVERRLETKTKRARVKRARRKPTREE